ncbi:MAG: chloride channel protein [Gemmatimonadetes bacterium]|nr:MAG: chloride channel protein [Gemmatimonadota bacterium]
MTAVAHTHRGDFTANPRVLVLAAMAALIGVASACVALILTKLISFFTNVFYFGRFTAGELSSPANNHLGIWALFIPVLGGLIIGLMARYGSEKIRGHGIPEALEAILIGRSRMEPKVAVLKPLSSAISIGAGGPFGAEGPIIMTGGAFGSLFGQAFHLSAPERKTLLVAGAAGGMAAIFAAPVASVLLAVELLLFEWKPRSFIPVATAAAVAGALRVPLMGPGPVFLTVPHAPLGLVALGGALAVGLVVGFASGLITRLVYVCEDLFEKLPIHWMWWPAIGGIVVGLGGLFYPHALGVGYDVIRDELNGRLVGLFVLGLLITKAVIWSASLGSGNSGGVLAPLLLMGGALGALVAPLLPSGDAGLWATLAMGAMMAGTMGAPFTAIAFMTEATHDINILPGLLIAAFAADAVTVLLMKRSILTEKIARRGTHVTREYSVNPLHLVRVSDVMEKDVPTVPASLPVDGLFERLADEDPVLARRQEWPVVDETDRLVGVVTRGDLVRAFERDDDNTTVGDIGSQRLIVTYEDELLDDATTKMIEHDIGRLPVVDRADPAKLVGLLGRAGVMAVWLYATREEQTRDSGWLSGGLKGLRSRVAMRLRRKSRGNGGDD